MTPHDLTPATRILLLLFSALTALAVVVLYGRPDATDLYFAWTIEPPLTAAFLGAGYGAGCVLVAVSLRGGRWEQVRVPLLTILVFTVVTLAATLLHLDRFHLAGAPPVATAAAWFWLVVYVVVPPSMLAVWVRQQRRARTGPALGLPAPLALALGVEGVLLSGVGMVLLVAPSSASVVWPWELTALTARSVAAWLLAFGLATVYAARFESVARARVQAMAYTVFGLLQLGALARFPDTPRWGEPVAWVYVSLVVLIILTGLAGVLLQRKAGPEPDLAAG